MVFLWYREINCFARCRPGVISEQLAMIDQEQDGQFQSANCEWSRKDMVGYSRVKMNSADG